jgi:hypothetical protein
MTNEELFYLLQKFYPGTVNGTHYLTGHKLDTEGEQFEEAFISNWRLSDPEPSPEQLQTWWREHHAEIQITVASARLRRERNGRLFAADIMVYKAKDSGDAEKEKAARAYRQALRDVPQQAGFPEEVEWPVLPDNP